MSDAAAQYDVFLSYSSADHVAVERLAKELQARGCRCFLDRWYLQVGRDWVAALERALSGSRSVAIVLGPGELGRWQQRERAWALDRMASLQDQFPVIPVLLPGAEAPAGFLQQLMWIDLRGADADAGRLDPQEERRQLDLLAQA
ncbi:MAG: toll/interleukin-1 receptor domain-containing protein, partial [Planctomycetaceae bacterium]